MLAQYDDADAHFRQALDLYDPDDHIGQAHTRHNLAVVSVKQERIGDALRHAEESLNLYRASAHRHGQVKGLNAVGWCHTLLGNHQEAITYCQQALSLYVELGDRLGEAGTWHSLGYTHHHLRQHDQAIDCYQHALDLFRELGNRYHEAETLDHLGDTHAATGDPDPARMVWRQAVAILTELDHPEADRVRAKLDSDVGPDTPRDLA
jgi:tetratricopeptide (TPR) repeat protein